ncbi:MAG: hypothetical protein CM15mV51_0410 [uncultured marine virus]|nr:MAG: hypothetical protein CM15mV51_0410 [uncultured marine virus]
MIFTHYIHILKVLYSTYTLSLGETLYLTIYTPSGMLTLSFTAILMFEHLNHMHLNSNQNLLRVQLKLEHYKKDCN